MPWWGDNKKLDFPRGYHIELGGGRRMPGFGSLSGVHLYHTTGGDGGLVSGGGYGKQLKDDYRRFYGATVGFAGRGEMIPNEAFVLRDRSNGRGSLGHSRAALPLEVDRLRTQASQAHAGDVPLDHPRDGRHAMSPMPTAEQGYGIEPGGRIIHEVGCVRMGKDPKTSVLNSNCQAHDCRNLFVTDGGPFVTNPDKNVTWTILALAMRTSEYIAEQRKAGSL